jgi:hypothetical protein
MAAEKISTKNYIKSKECKKCKVTFPITLFLTDNGVVYDTCVYCMLAQIGELQKNAKKGKIKDQTVVKEKEYILDSTAPFVKQAKQMKDDIVYGKLAISHKTYWTFIKKLEETGAQFKVYVIGKVVSKERIDKRKRKNNIFEALSKNIKESREKSLETNEDELLKAVIQDEINIDLSVFRMK